MNIRHYIVFIGPTRSLADELRVLEDHVASSRVIASPVKRHEYGITSAAIKKASTALVEQMRLDGDTSERARLSVWAYEPCWFVRGIMGGIWKSWVG